MKVLVTGSAGFIGSHAAARLLQQGHEVVGIDSLNDYYEVSLKLARLQSLGGIPSSEIGEHQFTRSTIFPNYKFRRLNTQSRELIDELFRLERFDTVCHLASQSGVRYSIQNPFAYIDNNVNGFITILEGCRNYGVKRLVYASSSSVYGDGDQVPYSESSCVDHPVSLYAATKKANELMAYSYSHLYRFETVGLRFFTVYGPWGRPDMAPYIFCQSIFENIPIKLFNSGDLYRDFTYIDDVVEGVVRTLFYQLPSQADIPYSIFNIGNHTPVSLTDFVKTMELACNRTAVVENFPMQQGDVHKTFADVERLASAVGFEPHTDIELGIKRFVEWYRNYYNVDL